MAHNPALHGSLITGLGSRFGVVQILGASNAIPGEFEAYSVVRVVESLVKCLH